MENRGDPTIQAREKAEKEAEFLANTPREDGSKRAGGIGKLRFLIAEEGLPVKGLGGERQVTAVST